MFMMTNPKKGRGNKQPKPDPKTPPAGPHEKERDESKAPGTGILPDEDEPGVEAPTG
jgi:hypothetical protein